jgi:CubicO group peptidase (beta-lactamase class C family)
MTRIALTLLFALAVPFTLHADSPKQALRDISSDLRPIVVQRGVPGLIAGIVDKDGLVALGAAGVRRKGSPAMISKNDLIHLGSCTKAMTATVIAMLVEDGKLSWDQTVSKSFPELDASMHEQWRGTTIAQLLQHRGGAPADLRFDGLWDRLWISNDPPAQQRMELVRAIVVRKPEAPPGSKFIYSNAGYAIAGTMAEHAVARGYEELMEERLFKPLEMTSAGFGAPGAADRNDQPRGHTEKGKVIEPGRDADNPPAIAPAATVHCSM